MENKNLNRNLIQIRHEFKNHFRLDESYYNYYYKESKRDNKIYIVTTQHNMVFEFIFANDESKNLLRVDFHPEPESTINHFGDGCKTPIIPLRLFANAIKIMDSLLVLYDENETIIGTIEWKPFG